MEKKYVFLIVIFILFIGALFLISSFTENEEKVEVEKYTLKINEEDILYEYNDYIYFLTDTSSFHSDSNICFVGMFAKNKKDYIPESSQQEFALLNEFNFCNVLYMDSYKKGVFIDGKFYYVSTDEKNVIEVYTLNGINILKEVITLAEGSAGFLGDFGVESIDDNYIYLTRYFYEDGKTNQVRCSKTSYTCELF